MAVELATAYVAIVPTTKGIAAQLEKELSDPIEQAAKKSGAAAGKALDQAGQTFTKFGIGALAVAGGIGVGLYKVQGAASDLHESINAVNVTFKDNAAGILKIGEGAAKALGLSKSEFNSLAVQFSAFTKTIAGDGGDVVQTMKDLTGRAADFASVMNLDVPEAAQIFQSALAGETEPIRRFGIDLSDAAVGAYAVSHGIADSTAHMSMAEKVQVRYSILMEKTAQDQGDFANTSKDAANATRIAQAEMKNAAASAGEALAPAMATAAGVVAGLAEKFIGLNESTGGWLAKGAGIAAVALGAVGGLSFMVGFVIKAHKAFGDLSTGITTLVTKFPKLGSAAKGAGILVGVAAIAFAAYEIDAAQAAKANENFAKSIDAVSSATDADLMKAYFDVIAKGFFTGKKDPTATLNEFAHANLEGARRVKEFAEASIAAGTATDLQRETLEPLTLAIRKEEGVRAQQAKTTADYGDKAGDAAAATVDLTGKTEQLAAADIILKGAHDGIAAAAAEAKRKGDEYAKSLIDQRQRVEDLYATERSAVDAKYAFAESSRQAQLDLANLNTVLADHKSKQEDVDTAVRTASGSILKASEDYATLNGAALGSENGVRRQIDALSAQAATLAPGSPLRTFLEGYIGDLNRVQTDIQTRLTLNISMGSVTTAAGDIIGVRAGLGKQFAEGGYTPGGRVLLGEDGPEVVDLPAHSYVHTAAASRSLMTNATSLMNSMSAGTNRGGMVIEHVDVHNDTDADGFFRMANFHLAAAS